MKGKVESIIDKFLNKVLTDFLNKEDLQGKWILYFPDKDDYKLFNSRDEALKYVYKDVRDVEYVILIQIPLSTEESYSAFVKMLTRSRS